MCFGEGQVKGLIQQIFKVSILEFPKWEVNVFVLEIKCFQHLLASSKDNDQQI